MYTPPPMYMLTPPRPKDPPFELCIEPEAADSEAFAANETCTKRAVNERDTC